MKKYLKLKKYVVSRMEKQMSIKHKMVNDVSQMLINIDNTPPPLGDDKSIL